MYSLLVRGGVVVCILAALVDVTALTGQGRNVHFELRNAKSLNRNRDVRAAPELTDVISAKNVEAASNFLKKSLYEFFHRIEHQGTKHSTLPRKPSKRTSARARHARRRLRLSGKRRGKIPKLRNDTDTSGRHERKCKFPFIHDGKTMYACIAFDENDPKNKEKRWCSTTSNYDRDMRWTYCRSDGTPVKRGRATGTHLATVRLTLEEPEEAYPNLAEMDKWETEVETMAEKKTLPGLSDSNDKKDPGVLEQLCENCLSKNDTETVIGNMAVEDVDDVDKNDERIHNLVSKEVDNFIGSVLAKHGVPDTEQKELLALNQKLSSELAQEVSCKMSIDQKIGSFKDDCKQFNFTNTSTNNTASITPTEKSNATTTNKTTISNDDLLKGEVDNFISTILSQHGVPSGKQEEIVKFIRKASTDIADQISYVVAYAKAGGGNGVAPKNESESGKTVLRNTTTPTNAVAANATKNSDNSIHSAVDNFLGLVLEKNGVPEDQQKDILRWNAQLSTDISDQVNSIVEDAKKLHEDFAQEETKANNGMKTAQEKLAVHNKAAQAMISQLKPALPSMKEESELEHELEGHLNHHADVGVDVSKEVSHMQDASKPIFKPIFHGKDEDRVSSSTPTDHSKDKDPLLQSLYNKAHEKEEKEEKVQTGGNFMNLYEGADGKGNDAYDDNKSYDDVSTENDIEIGLDDMNINDNGVDKNGDTMDFDGRGAAPDVIDSEEKAPENNEKTEKLENTEKTEKEKGTEKVEKTEQTGDVKNMTTHYPGVTDDKIRTGDADWDKYLMDNMWTAKSMNGDEPKPKSESQESKSDKLPSESVDHDSKKDRESIDAAKEQLDEEEKNMINYVSDSIIQSVKTVQPASAATNDTKEKNDVEFKKLDSGKKPFSIFRVNPGKEADTTKNIPGEDSIDTKTNKIVPGAKNINIIIINNQNASSLDLNEIENTIARSGEMSSTLGNSEVQKSSDMHRGSLDKSNGNKNLFLLLNTTATKEKLANATNATIGSSGDIAKEPHVNTTADEVEKSEKIEKSDKTDKSEKPEKLTNKSDTTEKSEKLPDKSEKPEKLTDKSYTTEKSEKLLDKSEKPEKLTDKSDTTEKPEKLTDKSDTTEKPEKLSDKSQNTEKTEKSEKSEKSEKLDKSIKKLSSPLLPSEETNSHFNFSRLLGEYAGNLAANSFSTLRKNGLVNMNYSPEEASIHTFGGNANGAKCKFPFIFDGDTYFNCINGYRERPWCSATANYDKLPIWGFCNDKEMRADPGNLALNAIREKARKQEELADIVHSEGEEVISKHSGMKTYGGNANGARCVIPFVYDGQTHMRCIPRIDGTAWCAASHSYDIHPVWGNCCDDDTYRC